MPTSKGREVLDPRNRVSDQQIRKLLDSSSATLFILQGDLVMKDLQKRYTPFGSDGIVVNNVVIEMGSDRADAYLFNAGTTEKISKERSEYRTRRLREIDANIKRLERERAQVLEGTF